MSNFSLINKRNIKNSSFYLDEKESHHIISVLRLKRDDELTLTDGEGNIYHALINDINKKTVKGKILKEEYIKPCLLYTSPSPRDQEASRMPSSA